MKKLSLIILSLFFVIQIVSGVSKVAVLDASLGDDVNINASAIVADTLNEQFVKSEDFIAIDRAYISKIQAEKKFQLSGDVSSDDIKELGALFGAEFICVANVSKLGSTYTVSARMIDVETAQVVSQESARKKGEIDVLFNVAEIVGSKLIGKEIVAAPAQTATPAKTAPAKPEPVPVKQTKKQGKGRPHFTVGYMFAGFMGDNGNDTYSGDSYYSFYEQDEYLVDNNLVSDAWTDNYAIDIHVLVPINKFYWSLGATYTEQILTYDDLSYYEDSWDNFNLLDITGGFGLLYPVGSNFQFYGGLNIGYMVFTLGSYWADEGESASGFLFGIELGGDYFIGDFCIIAKYKLSVSPDLTGDVVFTDDYVDLNGGDTSFGVNGLVLGIGFTW